MEEDGSLDFVSSSVINSPEPTSQWQNFLWLQNKKPNEEISLEEMQSEIAEAVYNPDQELEDRSSLSILIQQNSFINCSSDIIDVHGNDQDLPTGGSAYDKDDDDTDSAMSEVLVSIYDLLHFPSVEKELNGFSSQTEHQSAETRDPQNVDFKEVHGKDFSEPQIQSSVTIMSTEPEDTMSSDQIDLLERRQLDDHCYHLSTANLFPDHLNESYDSLSVEGSSLRLNNLEPIDQHNPHLSTETENGRAEEYMQLNATSVQVSIAADVIPSDSHYSADSVALETIRIEDIQPRRMDDADAQDTETSINENNEKQMKEILMVEKLLSDVTKQDFENNDITLKLLHEAQQILHQLHLQQSEETKNVKKRIQELGKCKTGRSLLLYKGRLLKSRCAQLLTVSNQYKKLHNKALSFLTKTQLSQDKVITGSSKNQEVVLAGDRMGPESEHIFVESNNGAVYSLAGDNQNGRNCIAPCPTEAVKSLCETPQQKFPSEIRTLQETPVLCYSNGIVPVNNSVQVEAIPVQNSTAGFQNFNTFIEPRIQTDLEKTSRENNPKMLECNLINTLQNNCRCSVQSQLPLNIDSSVTDERPHLLNAAEVTLESQRFNGTRLEEVGLDTTRRPIADTCETQFISNRQLQQLPTCFEKPSFNNGESIPENLTNLLPASHLLQTIIMPLSTHQVNSSPYDVYQQQQHRMAVSENLQSRDSSWPYHMLPQRPLEWRVCDSTSNVSKIELANQRPHANSKEHFAGSEWPGMPNLNDLGGRILTGFQNDPVLETKEYPTWDGTQKGLQGRIPLSSTSLKRLFDDGLVQPGMNVLTVKSKSGQVTGSITANGRIKNHRGRMFKTFRSWYLNALQLQTVSQDAINREVMYYGVPIGSLNSRTMPTGFKHYRKDTICTQNPTNESDMETQQKATDVAMETSSNNQTSDIRFFQMHSKNELELVNSEIWSMDVSFYSSWIEELDRWK